MAANPVPGPQASCIDIAEPLRRTGAGILASLGLAVVKIVTGIVGHSWALIADGIESIADVFSSMVVYISLCYSVRPPDEKHPYGHGKVETLAGMAIALALFASAGVIAYQSVHEIITPHQAPAWFTLPVLAGVVIGKFFLARFIGDAGQRHGSTAMKNDAFHHLSDALTSLAAFVGISLALIGGEGWQAADDWAALVACSIIVWNAVLLFRGSVDEMMDSTVPTETAELIRQLSRAVDGVHDIEKCRIRKSGLGLIMDIHVEVDGNLTVTEGHNIASAVKRALLASDFGVVDVTVHVEPIPWQRPGMDTTDEDGSQGSD